MEKEELGHTTKSELEFIAGIGCYSQSLKTEPELLKGYLISCEKRTDWAGMDKFSVIDAAKKRLEFLEKRAA